ncbi:tetratricopeptide repeat-containing sensor histidine kinase [Snuella sedimenti]|uniref:Tetratricopeptide repeat protein n=1 Tax=Snuella sedimenti TaxID=2798802 RepID=A0A8J7JB07_9FLAO|nr:tetratricopeptide repeat-containing sensor histidine kinase [Snuella sedimenti]MBJ6367759.1 tetratricopeptide repeat protein [Snuella sedimenti]
MQQRLAYAKKARQLALKKGIDSLVVESDINLASRYLELKNDALFLHFSHKGLKLASKRKDSSAIALISKKLGYYYYDRSVDSAYYYDNKAEKLFLALNDKFNRAVVLLDIALLQADEKDFTGSELTSINALSLLNELNETSEVLRYKAFVYNNLALVFKYLEQFDESIDYHLKALELKRKLSGDNTITIDNQKVNLANTFKASGKLDLALEYYDEILNKENLLNERPDFYALVLDNYAHTLYSLGKDEKLPGLYLKALRICDSIGDRYKSIIIHQHLAEYYHNYKKSDSARYHAYKAKDISEDYYNDDLLKSYLVLSKIETDSVAVKYYDAYIKLNDSIIKNERVIRNKFARIQYETDQIEQENIQIAKERLWLLILSVVLIVTSLLLYVVINQRNKNKELQFIQKQQETNEEIYNLMLSQHESIEEARALEKKRISQELHDGVLGRLFGTRLSLDSLNMSSSEDAVKTRSQYIDELKTIEQDIRKVSHELNTDFVSGGGFMDIIKTFVETQTKVYGLDYELKPDDSINWENLPNKNKIHIYRIIQETLHNIHKHAKASLVTISFKLKKDVICLTITDDGVGFDVNKAKSGIGLKNMNARINDIQGSISITSEKEVGTSVIIKAPIN